MGMFSYLCKGCKRGLHEGDACRLTLVDKGKVLKRSIGTYDGYGGIEENKNFRPDEKSETDPYDHHTMCDIEEDSIYSLPNEDDYYRFLNNYIDFHKPQEDLMKEVESMTGNNIFNGLHYYNLETGFIDPVLFRYKLKAPESGVIAWHQKCFDKSDLVRKICLIPSYHDPDQGWKSDREYIEDEIKSIKKRLEVLEKELKELPEEDG